MSKKPTVYNWKTAEDKIAKLEKEVEELGRQNGLKEATIKCLEMRMASKNAELEKKENKIVTMREELIQQKERIYYLENQLRIKERIENTK